MSSPHSETTTQGIRIHAAAEFMPQDVLPQEFRAPGDEPGESFVFRYQITISNVGDAPARLLSRHWVIVDSDGGQEEVRGRGVVGEFPKLEAGESYSYVATACCRPRGGRWRAHTPLSARMDRARGGDRRFFLVPTAPPLKLEQTSLCSPSGSALGSAVGRWVASWRGKDPAW